MDREKVIKHFEYLLNDAKGDYQDFMDLTVYDGEEILALLKEQDAVKPRNTYSETPSGKFIPHIFCGNCDKEIYAIYTFCPYCGKPISWTRQKGR